MTDSGATNNVPPLPPVHVVPSTIGNDHVPWIGSMRTTLPSTCELWKSVVKGVGAARAGAPSDRLAARPTANARDRREKVDETVADILGSLGWGNGHPGFESARRMP